MIKAITIASLICTASAFAVPIDPAPDHVGVYFDPGATITSFDSSPNIPFTVYVIITYPTAAQIWGAELSYHFVVPTGYENSYVRLDNSVPPNSVDFGDSEYPSLGDYYMGWASPYPQSDAVVFATWELVFMEEFPMDIYLGPSMRPSFDTGLPAYGAADSTVSLGPSSGSVSLPVATINGGVTDVPGTDLRSPMVLEQCQPNPFNPQTTIAYNLAQSGRVRLTIFDLTGHMVRSLVDGVKPAGQYEVAWDGTGDRGRQLASGVYVCRMEAGTSSETRRMTLVK